MMKKIAWIALCLGFWIQFTPAMADSKKPLTICSTTWGKLGGEDLPGKGFVSDLVMRVFRHAGYQIQTKIVPWPRCIALAKEQKFDLVASGWRGENFAPYFDYLNVIVKDTVNFITLENSPINSGTFETFHGKKVGLVKEAGGLEALFKNQENIGVVKVAELVKLPTMLVGGRFDAIVSDPVSLNEAIKTMKRPFEHKLKTLNPPLKVNLNSPLISNKHPNKGQIIADFDRSYKILVAEGMYDELIKIHDLQVQRPD
ncbi:MAG: transporter substrate-binding domain-containing protein [SAR324 cluster bacterium]|nr:transporter substrate-binding domain-containing protein [SAR324 cluster bacterium]